MAKQLNVTPMTIRRDLQLMENNGLVEKSHGGAVLTESIVKEATYTNRKLINIEAKRKIAKVAISFIESSMSILLDAGTTNYELAELMTHKKWENLTVVTNDLAIGQLLIAVEGIHVIMIGGIIDAESSSTCGLFAHNMVRQMHFDVCFLGTQAITPNWRIMTANALKQACLKVSDKSIILADQSKLGKHKLYDICDLGEADIFITDYTATKADLELFQKHNLTYIHA